MDGVFDKENNDFFDFSEETEFLFDAILPPEDRLIIWFDN